MHSKPSGKSLRLSLSVIVLISVAMFSIAGSAHAAWISMGAAEGDPIGVSVLEATTDRTVIEYTIGGFYADPILINGSTYFRIALPKESELLQTGYPALPHVGRSLIIPDASRMRVRVLDSETRDFAGLPVVPSKGNLLRSVDPSQVPYTFAAAYGSDRWFPESIVSGGDPYIMRDYRGMTVDLVPFQSRGADGTLRVTNRIVVEVTSDGASSTNVLVRSHPIGAIAEPFDDIYRHQFLNYGWNRYTSLTERGRMLIITYDGFRDAMAPFVAWKMQEGIPVDMVDISTIGNNTTSITNYIRTAYQQNGVAYVLLVGDSQQITTPQAAGGASDPTYTCLVGNDRYPELILGRFSAENVAHVQTQVARSVTYEQSPTVGGTWYAKGTGIGSNQGPGDDNEYDYQHEDVIRGKLLTYGYSQVDQIYDPGANATQVATALNNGRSVVNYTGHGSQNAWTTSGFSSTNVAQLQNDWLLPFIVSVACVNGQFNGGTCFAEAWLRSTHNGNPVGAVGTYMSSVNQSWNPPMAGQDAVMDLMVADAKHTFGGLCYNGSCQMMDEYGVSAGGDMFLTWHVFGDPSLMIRTKPPQTMTVAHEGSYILGQGDFPVSTGVPGALCALYANGALYGCAYADGSGNALVPVSPAPVEGTVLTLTTTAYNKVPAIDTVTVIPQTNANLEFQSFAIADSVGGDGDGLADAGETIDITLTLRNVGTDPATGVTATLTTSDPFVTLVQNVQTFGDIPVGGSAPSQGPYCLTLAPGTPDQHVVQLALLITADIGHWDSGFSITTNRPLMTYRGQHVDDAVPVGNGSGWITPGEEFDLQVLVANTGHANVENLVASALAGGSMYLDVVNGTGIVGSVAPGEDATSAPIRLVVREECPSPFIVYLRVTLTGDYGFTGTVQIPIQIGGFLDDVEANRGWTAGATDDTALRGLWLRANPVGTTNGGNVVQPEDDHTSALGLNCFVTGNGRPGESADSSCVRGGRTTLLTPVFDLHGVETATMSYWFWYTNNRGNNPGVDFWDVEITNDGGQNWVPIEHSTESTNAWVQRNYNLATFISLTGQVQIRFVASESGSGALVEGLVDDFILSVTDSQADVAVVGSSPLAFSIDRVLPNPAQGPAEIRYRVPNQTAVSLGIYDVAGRLVRTLADGAIGAGEHQVRWDRKTNSGARAGAGVYFVRMHAGGNTQVRQITLIN
jgi:hypothetical protein